MKIDLARARRRIKPEKWIGTLPLRDSGALNFVEGAASSGPALLFDTCVYLDILKGRLPAAAASLIKTRLVRHVSVVLGELTHLFGRLRCSPSNRQMLAKLAETINFIEARHMSQPSAGVALEAGILCGLVFRLGGFQAGQEVAALNDATIYLHALEHGQTVLTRNRNDFDRMNQIIPDGRVIFYNPV